MKIPTMLLQRVLLDVGSQLSDTIDMDYREICSRYRKEGMSFLCITLPTLDDALLKGLTQGRLTRDMYTGFRSVSRRRSLPALLQGFFRRIFDDDGFVKPEPDVCAIYAIRQVTRLFKKVEIPCTKPRIKAAFERYRCNDEEVDWRRNNVHFDSRLFGTVSGILWSGLELLSGELYCFPGVFGPGATAERLKRNERQSITQWPERSEGSFPSSFHATHREDFGPSNGITYLSMEEEQPVRVVQVPKTLKTPRTISVEPSYMMLMQQSIAKPLMVYLESRSFGFQSIRFVDQSINNRLAREGSVDGRLATIDLKDASDLVDYDLVREIFRGPCPTFLNLIEDCRTTTALMPDKTIFPLKKFASMGSAMCFPIESMVFFTIIMYALVKHSGRVPSRRSMQALAKNVAVYGDDIVIPSLMAPVVMETLEAFGLKVNHDKSFHTGLFRESCGGDYYKGENITPAYVRQWDDTGTLSNSSHLVAYAALSNTFYMKGLWHACQYIRDEVSRAVRAVIPLSRTPIGCVHFTSYLSDSNVKWDTKLSGYRVKGYRVRSAKEPDCPTNMAGFLGLAFQSRFVRERLRGFKASVSLAAVTQRDQEGLPHSSRRDGATLHRTGLREGIFLRDAHCIQQETPSHISTDGAALPRAVPSNGDSRAEACDNSVWVDSGEDGAARSTNVLLAYSELVRTGCIPPSGRVDPFGNGVRDNLEHLTSAHGSSLYTSDRPHALSLKRGWTASQAGLVW
nr:MAG: hypothetical protein 3 [Leviviridae sp.]